MKLLARWCASIAIVALAACASVPGEDVRKELVPTGKLRVGIGVGATPSAFWATRDPASGQPRGVTVSLANALSARLGVPLELVIYANSGELTAAGPKGEWDAAFMPVDDERRKVVDFGPNYYLSTSTFLVPAGSAIRTLAEVDRPGVRVAGVEATATARAAARSLKAAKLSTFRTVEELLAKLRAGETDALALGRESLLGLSKQLPGSRVLDGHYLATGVSVAVPKNRPAALAYVQEFIEQAKADGTVRRALDGAGFGALPVAP